MWGEEGLAGYARSRRDEVGVGGLLLHAAAEELGPLRARGISNQLPGFIKKGGKKKIWLWAPRSSSRRGALLPASKITPRCVFGRGGWIHTGLALLWLFFLFSQKELATIYFSNRGLGAVAVLFLSFNFSPCAASQFWRGRGTFPRARELPWQGPSPGKGLSRTS